MLHPKVLESIIRHKNLQYFQTYRVTTLFGNSISVRVQHREENLLQLHLQREGQFLLVIL